MEGYIKDLIPILERRIKNYHLDFSIPLIGEQWEEVLHRSFGELNINTTWTPLRSHSVGEDMRIEGIDNSRISCKSGQFINNKKHGVCVKFNGGRSTSHTNLEDKLDHFCASHDDYYFLLSKKKQFDKTYKLIVFESTLCCINQLNWFEHSGGKSWIGSGIFESIISKNMSGQLWTTLPLSLIEHIYEIDCRE
tara:strand:+ start:85 stop:663 length:579 start_codon:yes stop_codon:yes gene_type:complete